MTSTTSLEIIGGGAVTAVGLTAPQTCAAIRAGIKRFSPIEAWIVEHEEPRVGARVSADPRLRADEGAWLLNLAGRALLECARVGGAGDVHDTALLLLVPEEHRGHPLSAGVGDSALLRTLEDHTGLRFAPSSRVLRSGAAACVEALGLARELLASRAATRCIIGGADSLLRVPDLDKLGRDDRLIGPKQSQGLVPGEGAAFIVVGPGVGSGVGSGRAAATTDDDNAAPPRRTVRVHGVGLGYERNTVLGTEYSVGEAFASAIETALQDADVPEPEVDFVAGNFNGERYDAWELSHANARGYRTRRERLPTLWPAGSTGELGVAGGVIALLAAADAIAEDYAEGPTGAVQVRSDGELRGVALLRGDEQPETRAGPEAEPGAEPSPTPG